MQSVAAAPASAHHANGPSHLPTAIQPASSGPDAVKTPPSSDVTVVTGVSCSKKLGMDIGDGIASLHLTHAGFLHLRWPEGASVSEDHALLAMEAVNRTAGTNRYPMLVDMAVTKDVSRGARKVFTRPCAASRIALLGSSPVDRTFANFFLGVHPPPCPTVYFTDRAQATAWLHEPDAHRSHQR